MKIILSGYGAMGKVVHECFTSEDELAGIVSDGYETSFNSLAGDVIIDFSHHSKIKEIKEYALKTKTPVVIATTGYTESELAMIDEISHQVPVLFSANYSLGVIIMNRIIRDISPLMRQSFDVELIEKHHNKKEDSPSGTAKMLLKSIEGDDEIPCVYGRSGHQKRQPLKEIGVHAVRGGTIVGEHEVIYAGLDEVLSIKHEAFSKRIFAKGALTGAKWLLEQKPGLYDMEDVLFGGKQ